jgi:hypothetical protein
MKTPFENGQINVRFTIPEANLMTKAFKMVQTLASMNPINPALSAAAKSAIDPLATILKLASGTPAILPLFDGNKTLPPDSTDDN